VLMKAAGTVVGMAAVAALQTERVAEQSSWK
jgi:hypothetical protein